MKKTKDSPKSYTQRNFLELLKYVFFIHGGSAAVYIAVYSSAEAKYTDLGRLDMLNTIFLFVAAVTFAVSITVMLTAHFKNSEKKMNYLNATYEGGNEGKVAFATALKESGTVALAYALFQIPMIIIFFNVGYRYGIASVFETLYICDVGIYIFFGNPIVGALTIALAYFLLYLLGVALIICPMWSMGRIRKAGAPTTPDAPEQDAYYRGTVENTYKIFSAAKKAALAYLITFGIFTVLSPVFIAFSSGMSKSGAAIFNGLLYAIVFYGVHGYRRDGSYFPHEKRFSPVKETVAFFREELVYYSILFAIPALACEIYCLATGGAGALTEALRFILPFYGAITVPVLRTLASLAWAVLTVLACAVLRSYLDHRKVARASRYRR